MSRILEKASAGIAIFMSLFHLYAGWRGTLDPWTLRVTHLMLGFLVAFLTYPTFKGKKVNWVDLTLFGLALASGLYILIYKDQIIQRAGLPTKWDVVFGIITIVLVLEMTRRVVGLALVVVAGVFLLYAYLGPHMPSLLAHRGYSLERIASHMYTTLEGIYGVPISVSASFVILFVIFGAFLEATKTGDLFLNVANAIAGRWRGGPAKVAVIASGFFGTISGSAVANVVGTGSYTIPLMKRIGYAPYFAGAVEAVASSGGQLVPPVMGAAAFIISEILGIPYIKICVAAVLPALLYYVGLFTAVHMEAVKTGLRGLRDEEVPDLKNVLKTQGHLFASLFVLVYLLAVAMKSPGYSAFWAIVTSIIVSFLRKSTRLNLKSFLRALESGAKGALTVVAACAAAGIVIGVVTLTGLGLKFSATLVHLAHGNLYLTLIFTMVASLILGMGLPTTAAYIICAVLAAPALIKLGVQPLAAHLFVFYFAIISAITPPVALAAYAAAGIAKDSPMKIGFTACRIGLAVFLVPYVFIFQPALLMKGAPQTIMWVTFTGIVGVILLACSTIGWFLESLSLWERVFLFASSLLLIEPRVLTDVVGACLVIPVVLSQLRKRNRKKEERP